MPACFVRDNKGNVTVMFGLALVPLCIAVGSGIDYADLKRKETALQIAADRAALGSANFLMDNSVPPEKRVQTAKDKAAAILRPELADITPDIRVSLAGYNGGTESSVSVYLSHNKPLFFGNVLGVGSTSTVAVTAKAIPGYNPGACMIALDTSAAGSFAVSGSGSVSVPNCSVHVNSSSSSALTQSGAGRLSAKSIAVVGGYSGSNWSPLPKTMQKAIADPLADVPQPTVPTSCSYTNYVFSAPTTFGANTVFCGKISFAAPVTFQSGIHYFKGAEVEIGSRGDLVGSDLMLYFDRYTTVTATSSSKVSLSAMKEGTYAGIALFASRFANGTPFKLKGGSQFNISGTIYLPSSRLELNGTPDLNVTSKAGYVIAKQFSYHGDSNFTFDSYGGIAPKTLVSKSSYLVR